MVLVLCMCEFIMIFSLIIHREFDKVLFELDKVNATIPITLTPWRSPATEMIRGKGVNMEIDKETQPARSLDPVHTSTLSGGRTPRQ